MTKPDYKTLLAQIAQETDPVRKQELIDECYVFTEELTDEEKELFGYMNDDYVEKNPGIAGNMFSSYVGIYINQEGERTG
jgi:hypothetical protein